MSEAKVFISHAYKDRVIVDAFVELLTKAGIPERKIVCSSTPGTQIHAGRPLYAELRRELSNEKVFVIFMLSDNFYASSVCLNEMGAAWIMNTKNEMILLPGFGFEKVAGVICENNLVGISLKSYNKASVDRFAQLRENLVNHGFKIPTKRWNLAVIDFFSVIENYLKTQNAKPPFSMKSHRGVCIGDDNSYGCKILGMDSNENRTVAVVDFNLTSSNICGLVYYTEVNDWTGYLKDGARICFEICSDTGSFPAEIEMHLSNGRNISSPIVVSTRKNSYQIPLSQFTDSEKAWSNTVEICFLFRKDNLPVQEKIVIENLRVES